MTASTAGPDFAALHRPGHPFLLPNAWDVASALLLAHAASRQWARQASA